MTEVFKDERGVFVCSCGAECRERKDIVRFLRRHPRLCSERREYTKQLARGTRCVEDEERKVPDYEIEGKEW